MSKYSKCITSIGGQIQLLRRQQGLSQEKFAQLIKRTSPHLSKIERGEKSPSLELLLSIADNLNVPPSELFKEAKPKESKSISQVKSRINALLNVTTPKKAKLILSIAQQINSTID